MNGEETRFKIGNEAALKWTEEKVSDIFAKMVENTKNDAKILCLQDAIMSVDLYSSSINYLIDKFPVFENIKKDIQDIIISRINTKVLNNEFNPTASIWRFKQLGEKDEKVIDNKSSDGSMATVKLDPEAAKAVSKNLDEEV